MTTGLSYDGTVSGTNSYIDQIATMAVVDSSDVNFLTVLPQMITYAENRIYRDLDFISTVKSSSTHQVLAGQRNVSVGSDEFVTIQQINIIQPAGTSNPDLGTRTALLPTTKEFLDTVYSSVANSGVPTYFAMINQSNFIVGPWSNSNYYVEIVGTYRPNSLSSSNKTTFISTYFPDLFIMASMIYISAFQRNFGRMSDDPAMAQSYESQYNALLKGSIVEEFRKKFQSGGWTSMSPAVISSPSRG